MKLPRLVGAAAGPVEHDVDARWLMAYAAALGDCGPEYLDTARPGGIVGHPLFAVCYEWPIAVALRARMPDGVAVRSVHATHDLRLYRRARPGDRLRTTATVISAQPRSPGAYVVTRFETTDAEGRPVSRTDYGSIYRGVECEAAGTAPVDAEPWPERGSDDPRRSEQWSADVAVAAGLAHVYTECARIWNPIHTDRAVAQSAGLPEIILHGTATLALAVSAALARAPGGPAAPVARIACRFTGMVPLPSSLSVRGDDAPVAGGGHVSRFEVAGPDGGVVLKDGRLLVGGGVATAAPSSGPA